MAATGKVIGTVTAVVGEAKATAADGTVRILQVGDVVHGDEVITTSAAGSINVALESGKTLDCGGDIELTLHESVLNVATAAEPSADATAFDVDVIQRAITAGQDPSQVAAATAAGGAPAAGGSDLDGGAHEPVILEQSNAASVVTSGFATEGETLTFAVPQTQSLQPVVVAAVSAQPESHAENPLSSAPAQATFENTVSFHVEAPASDQAPAPATVSAPAAIEIATVVETAPVQPAESNGAPQIVPSPDPVVVTNDSPASDGTPAIFATDTPAQEQVAGAPQVALNSDPVVVTSDTPVSDNTPVIVVTDTAGDQVAEAPQSPVAPTSSDTASVVDEAPIIVVTDNGGEQTNENTQPAVVTEQTDEIPPLTSNEGSSPEVPTSENHGSLSYSISANTNQDEQLALLTFENDGHIFQSLVFFGQEGQQKPTATPLDFEVNYAAGSTVKLQYIDSFAGNSDANTGHTATKIAIKDFALSEAGNEILLAKESDGVNIGIGRTIKTEASVQIDGNGHVGDWSFANPDTNVNDRATYDGSSKTGSNGGFDILDVTGNALDLRNLDDSQIENFEVIALKGSAAQELTLGIGDVLKVTDGADVLHVLGGKEDTLNVAGSGWNVVDGDANAAGIQASYFGWVQVQHTSGAILLVDPDVHVNLMG